MNESSLPSRFARHKLVTLIIGTLATSLILVAIALWLYASSGTELLDLSRPGYQDVSKKLSKENAADNGFPSTGALDHDTVMKFQALYNKSVTKVTSGDPFGGDPLSPDTLGLSQMPGTVQ